MDAEWSIAAADDDPVIVVPWSDDESMLRFVDLRSNLHLIEEVSEAKVWPEMHSALLRLNGKGSAVWTSKCDAWVLSDDEKQLDFGPVQHGFGAYFDVFHAQNACFLSLAALKSWVQCLCSAAVELPPGDARAAFVIRPAWRHEEEGHATTIYVYGYGDDEDAARSHWSQALLNIAGLVRTWAG